MSGRVRGPGRVRTAGGNRFAQWWPAVDLLVLASLVVIGSVLLLPVYGSAAPVVATAVGAALSAIVLLLVERFQLPGWLGVTCIAVLAIPVGSLLVAPDLRRLGFLPSIEGVRTVLGGLLGGWRDLLTVAVPTGVAGTLLLPPFVIGIVGSAVAGAVVMSGRRVLALVVPGLTLVLFALFGAVAVDPLTVAAVTGFFLVAALGWVLWIDARTAYRVDARQAEPFGNVSDKLAPAAASPLRAGRTAGSITRQALAVRRIAIAVAVLAVAAGVGTLTATALGPGRAALRGTVELPVDPAVLASPLGTFRSFTKDQRDITLMTATGLSAGARLRLAALDSYDGRQFTASNDEGPFVRIGRERAGAGTGTPTSLAVTMQGYSGPFLPLPGPLDAIDFTGDRAAELTDDLRYSASAETGLLPGGWQPGDQYTVLATVPPQPTEDQLAAAAVSAAPSALTAPLPDLLRAKASSYSSKAPTAGGKVEAIRSGLAADGQFSHGDDQWQSAAGHGLDRMTAMMTAVPMVGDQEQYATLMALMVRSIGLPARVAVGFLAPPGSDAGATVPLRGSNISAWVEVPFDDYGWVAFDPSPDPNKLPAQEPQQSQTERRAVAVQVPAALPQTQPDSVDTEDADQRPDDADPEPPAAPQTSTLLLVVLAILGWVAALIALVSVPVLVILGLKAARRRRRRRAEHPKDQITGGWAELLDTAIDSGYRPTPWLTRTETAADLQEAGVLQVDWPAPAADAAQFSPGPVDSERARGYWREVDDRSAELLGGLPWWRRWRARLSLASMRRLDGRAGR